MIKSLSSIFRNYSEYLKKMNTTYSKSPTNSNKDLIDPYASFRSVPDNPPEKNTSQKQ